MTTVLLIGSGGREHALARALAQSPKLEALWIAPGNPGTAAFGENIDLNIGDPQNIVDFCKNKNIGLVVIGPEQPLVDGLVDVLDHAGILAFGPSRAAAQVEGSKAFTKSLCDQAGIPTAAYKRFDDQTAALAYLDRVGAPIVIKADGLAAGKGVIVADTIEEARAGLRACFSGAFGASGARVVIEEKLEGEEVSFFALCDGERALAFASAQDHKRVGEGDSGPNTGGMGAYSPAPIMTRPMEARVMREIILPAIERLRAEGTPFKGVLFAGLMIGEDGPKLIEFNARFGDPETQAMLPRLDCDFLELLLDCSQGRLTRTSIPLKPQNALTVVLAAKGYPGEPERGSKILGLEAASRCENTLITLAGVGAKNGEIFAQGGRVLNVTGLGKTLEEAARNAYNAIQRIDWPGGFWRRDIGWRALKK